MSNETKTREIPAAACTLNVGEFQYLRKSETDKSGSLRLVARSGQPVEHWFWGRVVHDLAGMQLHKKRLAVDYVHDPKEIIGYLNRFEMEDGNLVTSGALVPFKDSDRATEIMHKMDMGVPYEASINFGGDGIRIEELLEGESTQVNGYTFSGPGCVVREWPLRGVAICPYGADMRTESAMFADGNAKTIKATVMTVAANTEDKDMEDVKPDDVAPVESPETEEQFEQAEVAVEGAVAEVEVEAQAEAETVEAEQTASEEPEATTEEKLNEEPVKVLAESDPKAEFKAIKQEFGAEIAAEVFEAGGDYNDALKLAYQRLKNQAEKWREQAESVSAGTPASFSSTDNKNEIDSFGVHKLFRDGTRKPKQ